MQFCNDIHIVINKVQVQVQVDGTKIVLVNIYAPNDATQQVVFLRDVSKEFLIPYANDNLVLGGDFNRTISTLDKKGGRPVSQQKSFSQRASVVNQNTQFT